MLIQQIWINTIKSKRDNSISKTCNFPPNATKEDVARAYTSGWELGCRGLTVYVAGSRKEVVLETKEVTEKKEGSKEDLVKVGSYDRPIRLIGSTYKLNKLFTLLCSPLSYTLYSSTSSPK